MIPNRDKAKGQALIEFALNLIVRLIIAIILSDRLFQDWITGQNSWGATERFSLTGQIETEFLFELPAYIDARAISIKDKALRNTAGADAFPCNFGVSYSPNVEAGISR